MGRSDSPPSVSTRSIFFTSRYHRVARGLLPSVVGVPPGARELSVPVSPSGLTMETSGSLRFLGNPGGHCPCSSTPAGSGRLSGPRVSCLTRPPPVSTTKAPRRLVLSGLNHTTFDLAVYASQDGSPHHHARLASGCWSSFARRDSYPQGFNERFQSSSLFLLSKAYLTQGHHTHLLCFFQGTELRDSVRFGERSPRLDPVGVSVISAPPAPLVANAEPLERSKSGGSGAKSIRMRHRFKALTLPQLNRKLHLCRKSFA